MSNTWMVVQAEYVKKYNACKEKRIKSNLTADQAIDYLNENRGIPLYIYCDGMQDHDLFFKFFWLPNDEYRTELKKIKVY